MTFNDWWLENGRDVSIDAAINADIDREDDRERLIANEAWLAARQEFKKDDSFLVLIAFAEHFMSENGCDCEGGCRCGYICLRTAVDQIRGV